MDFHIKEMGLYDDEMLCLCPMTGLMWILIETRELTIEIVITPEAAYYLKKDSARGLCVSHSWRNEVDLVYGGRCLDDLELRSPDPLLVAKIPEEHKVPCPTFYSEE